MYNSELSTLDVTIAAKQTCFGRRKVERSANITPLQSAFLALYSTKITITIVVDYLLTTSDSKAPAMPLYLETKRRSTLSISSHLFELPQIFIQLFSTDCVLKTSIVNCSVRLIVVDLKVWRWRPEYHKNWSSDCLVFAIFTSRHFGWNSNINFCDYLPPVF